MFALARIEFKPMPCEPFPFPKSHRLPKTHCFLSTGSQDPDQFDVTPHQPSARAEKYPFQLLNSAFRSQEGRCSSAALQHTQYSPRPRGSYRTEASAPLPSPEKLVSP